MGNVSGMAGIRNTAAKVAGRERTITTPKKKTPEWILGLAVEGLPA